MLVVVVVVVVVVGGGGGFMGSLWLSANEDARPHISTHLHPAPPRADIDDWVQKQHHTHIHHPTQMWSHIHHHPITPNNIHHQPIHSAVPFPLTLSDLQVLRSRPL